MVLLISRPEAIYGQVTIMESRLSKHICDSSWKTHHRKLLSILTLCFQHIFGYGDVDYTSHSSSRVHQGMMLQGEEFWEAAIDNRASAINNLLKVLSLDLARLPQHIWCRFLGLGGLS